jgi:phosphoribosylformylglycinamidine cyclo-ligase
MEPGEFDLVGFAVGVVERSEILPRGMAAGDRIVGLVSPGLRCNGYSLARRALLDRRGRSIDEPAWDGATRSLGAELLVPSVIYAPMMAALRAEVPVHGFAHITGGGIPGNLNRALPDRCDGVVRRGSWTEPRIFAEIQAAGDVDDDEMEHVFNLGLGMLAIVPAGEETRAVDVLQGAGVEAFVVGEVVDGHGDARVERA